MGICPYIQGLPKPPVEWTEEIKVNLLHKCLNVLLYLACLIVGTYVWGTIFYFPGLPPLTAEVGGLIITILLLEIIKQEYRRILMDRAVLAYLNYGANGVVILRGPWVGKGPLLIKATKQYPWCKPAWIRAEENLQDLRDYVVGVELPDGLFEPVPLENIKWRTV